MAKYYGAAAQGKKGRPECPTATQVRSLAQVHFWLPSSLSSIRFPCLPACLPACLPSAEESGRRRRSRRRRPRRWAAPRRRRLIARALGFALVSSLQAHLRTSRARRDLHILATGSASRRPPLLRHMSSPWKGEWMVVVAAAMAAAAAACVEWAVLAGSKVKYSVILALQQVSWVGWLLGWLA